MKEVKMQSYKHDGRKHRGWVKLYQVLGEKGILWIDPNTPVVEADGSQWSSPFPVIYWVHPEKWFNIAILCKEESTGYYCNIASPIEYDAEKNEYSFIDYDVDLIVSDDGVAEIVDEEELTEHAHAMRYPDDVLHKIAEATAELQALFEAREGPFDPEARTRYTQAWLDSIPS